ncbi:hypothetical protein ACSVIJ_19105 [Pseudomonas sp. NCHU5208]|uniref:hypothetical protein n=1 Tax=unclassified Pseudomonas TaxID=196821 RepID=UPI003F97DC29
MIPAPVIEHAVTVTLKDYDDMEIILLKGHLILEQMLNQILMAHGLDIKRIENMRLMYGKTLELVSALNGQYLKSEYQHLKKINQIRNSIAHKLFPENYDVDLKEWSCSVLGQTPKTINTKRTYKKHVIKAFSFLVGKLQGMADGIEPAKL